MTPDTTPPPEHRDGETARPAEESATAESGPETASGADSAPPPPPEDEAPTAQPDPHAPAPPGETPPPGGDDSDPDPGENDEQLPEMGFLEHLEELRKRLVRCILAAILGSLACYAFSKPMFDKLMEPMVKVLNKSQFIYTYPPEAFFSYIKISLVAGVFLTSPYIFVQIWRFIAPALYKDERKWIIPIAVFSAVFFVTGALFGYFVVFPYGFKFFASFTTEQIQFMPKLSEYLGFSLKLLLAFGIVFELPLFVFFLAKLGMVSSKGMRKKRKYAILIGFILSAILTPPDPFTQSLMAGPIVLLYELSIWVAYFFGKKDKSEREQKKAEEAAEAGAGAGES
jgi:sec-independent protein translocase protein TatC